METHVPPPLGPRLAYKDQAKPYARMHVSAPRHPWNGPTSHFHISMTHKRQVTWERQAHAPTLKFCLSLFRMGNSRVPLPTPRDTVTRKRVRRREEETPHRLARASRTNTI